MTRAGLPFASGTISRSICSVSGSPVFDHTLIVRAAGLPHNVSRDSLRRTLLTSSPRLAVSSSSAEAAKREAMPFDERFWNDSRSEAMSYTHTFRSDC